MKELFSAEEQPDEIAEILQKGDEKQHLNKRKPQSALITRWKPLQVSFQSLQLLPFGLLSGDMLAKFQRYARDILPVKTHIENPQVIVISFLALSCSGLSLGER